MATMNAQQKRIRIKRKIRTAVSGSPSVPRLSVFRSNKFLSAQLIDDTQGVTLASVHETAKTKGAKVARAEALGEQLASTATAKGITKVVFDRNGFRYAGRIKAFADAARKAGLIF